MKSWSVNYKGHTIRVECHTGGEMRLLVDGELQDTEFSLYYTRLNGIIRSGDGAGEEIKVALCRRLFVRSCRIFVDHRLAE